MNNLTEKKAHKFCNDALELKHDVEARFVLLGQLLYEIKINLYFESGWESWGEFLMDMRLSESMATKLMKVYTTFVLDYKITPMKLAEAGGWTVVYDLVPLATTKEKAIEWIARAADMTRSDIRKEAQEAKGEKVDEDCEHEWAKCCVKCRMKYD